MTRPHSTILRAAYRFLLICALFITSGAAQAALTWSLPATSSTGSYTMTWTGGRMWIEVWENVGGTWVKQTQNSPSGSYTVSGRSSGTYTYYLMDCMQNQSGIACAPSNTASVTVTLTAPIPGAPTSVGAAQSGTSAVVSWSAVSGATSYKVLRGGSQLATTAATSYTDSTVSAGASYTYQVQACNANGCSTSTSSNMLVMDVPPPAAPAYVSATSAGGYATLDWPAVSGAVSYRVQRVGQDLTRDSGSTHYVDGTSVVGSSYTYLVKACAANASICSAYTTSNAVTVMPVVPATPASLSATASGGAIVLSWAGVSGAASYTLQKTVGGAVSTLTGITGASYTDSGVAAATTYSYKVQACNASGCSALSGSAAATTVPAAPSGVSASAGSGYAAVSWASVSGATSYRVQRVGGTAVTVTATSYTDTSVAVGGSYSYQVSACNSSGCSGAVGSNTVTIPAPVPATPTGVIVSPGSSSIAIGWSAVSGATSYTIQKTAGGTTSNITGVSGTSYTDTAVAANTSYGYRVQACNGSGCSALSASVSAVTIPAAPATVQASSVDGYAYISWSAVPGATSYIVRPTILTNGTSATVTSTDYLYTAVTVGATFTFQVSACNSGGCSAYVNSNAVTITPPAPAMPSGVGAVASGSAITVSWAAVSGATSYTVQRTVGGVASSITGVTATSYTDSGLASNTTYSYNIKACNSNGCSALSATASATTPSLPAVPTGLTAVAGGSSVALSWGAASNATSYTLQRTVGGVVSTITGISATGYTDAGLAANTTYSYSVQACNASGCSALSGSVSATTAPGAPTSPGPVTVGQSGAAVTLAWPAVSGATSYKLKRVNGAVVTSLPDATSNTATDASVAVDTDYVYQVQACNSGGCSAATSSAAIRIAHVPAPPASLDALVRPNFIYLTWPNADAAATSFQLTRNGGALATIATAPYTDAGVTKGTSYTYTVKACNNTGCSAAVSSAAAVAGAVAAGVKVVDGYDYNVLGRLTKVKENGAAKTQYEYDSAGNRKQVTE